MGSVKFFHFISEKNAGFWDGALTITHLPQPTELSFKQNIFFSPLKIWGVKSEINEKYKNINISNFLGHCSILQYSIRTWF